MQKTTCMLMLILGIIPERFGGENWARQCFNFFGGKPLNWYRCLNGDCRPLAPFQTHFSPVPSSKHGLYTQPRSRHTSEPYPCYRQTRNIVPRFRKWPWISPTITKHIYLLAQLMSSFPFWNTMASKILIFWPFCEEFRSKPLSTRAYYAFTDISCSIPFRPDGLLKYNPVRVFDRLWKYNPVCPNSVPPSYRESSRTHPYPNKTNTAFTKKYSPKQNDW